MFFKQLLSYFIPVRIHEVESEINKNLEVTLNNGKLVLDSKNTNFSYGNLQKVLRYGLKIIGFETIKNLESILILGVAGGSVIKTLIDEIFYEGKIVGVEIDPKTIEIANKYFELNKVINLEIIIADAQEFIKQNEKTFDLIIIDVFQDNNMPSFLFETTFYKSILLNLNTNGIVLFNSIVSNRNDKVRNDSFEEIAKKIFSNSQKFSNIEGDNELFILKK